MEKLLVNGYNVTIELFEDGWFVIECLDIPGCVSQGRTREEAIENIKDAMGGCLEVKHKWKDLDELFAEYGGDYEPSEIDTGPPVKKRGMVVIIKQPQSPVVVVKSFSTSTLTLEGNP